MTAPIRPEHREAASYAVRLCNFLSEADYLLAIDALAQLLADTEATQDAEIARLKAERDEACVELLRAQGVKVGATPLSAEYAAAVRALAGVRPKYGHFCPVLLDERRYGHTDACIEAERVLSTPRARAVLEQGETT